MNSSNQRTSAVLFGGLFGGVLLAILLLPSSVQAQHQALSPGAMLPQPDTNLKRLDGTSTPVADLLGRKATVFLFWSNQCPWVDRYEPRVRDLVEEFQSSEVQFVRVNANNLDQDASASLQACREQAQQQGYKAPYVRDPGATFAKALGASQTPQVFLFNAQRKLIYTGSIDDSPSAPDRVQESYLRDAITALLDGGVPQVQSTDPFGCTLKYPG